MKNGNEDKKEYYRKGFVAFLVIAASLVFYFFLLRIDGIAGFVSKLFSVLQPVIIGLAMAYIMNPMSNILKSRLLPFLKKRMKSEDKARSAATTISVFVSLIFLLLIIVGIIWLIIPQFIKSVSNIAAVLPGQIDSLADKARGLLSENPKLESIVQKFLQYEKDWLQNDLADYANKAASYVAGGVIDVVTFIKDIIVGFVIAIYFMLSKRQFVNRSRKLFYAVFNEKTVDKLFTWISKSHAIFSGFINGKLLDSLIIGVLCFIGTCIMNTPYAVLVSVIICVTNVIPVFGPWIGGIPSTVLIMLTDPMKGLYFGIFVILLQTLDGNIIGPKILGKKTGVGNFWVVFAIVVGGGMFGVIGMLIGVPVFGVIYYLGGTFVNYLLRRKNKSTNSEDYYKSNGEIKTPSPELKEDSDAQESTD